jgi:hypothetical protein
MEGFNIYRWRTDGSGISADTLFVSKRYPKRREVILANPETGRPFPQRRDMSIGLPSYLPFQRK